MRPRFILLKHNPPWRLATISHMLLLCDEWWDNLNHDNVDTFGYNGQWTVLREAVTCGLIEYVQWLVRDLGADINKPSNIGGTPINCAILNQSPEMVRMLLDLGATINTNTERPLDLAFRRRHLFDHIPNVQQDIDLIILLLLDRGAKLTLTDNDDNGDVPIPQWAVQFVKARESCRYVSILFLAFHHFHKSRILTINGKDATVVIAKTIWSTRFSEKWQ